MNKPIKHGSWGTTTDYRDLLRQIAEIGPALEANATADEESGELTSATFALLKPLRMSHIFAAESLGGAQLRPTQGLELLEAITWYSGAAGWVS
ncbi:MAG: acyl-CoA dehydrogenase, partial [Mesorhizobium sp.]